MRQPRIGDIVEIDGNDGLRYFGQYSHQHPVFGGLLRIYDFRCPSDYQVSIDEIARRPVKLSVFYPLRRSIKEGIFRIIGNSTVRGQEAVFPVFRDGHINPSTGKIEEWWLWDGNQEWFVGALKNPEEYPLRQIVNDTLLRELVQGCVD